MRQLEEHVHLLPDEQRRLVLHHFVDHLQDAGVDAFGVVAGERAFGDDERLDALITKYFPDMVAYLDNFYMLFWLLLAFVPLAFIAKRPPMPGQSSVAPRK